MSCEEFGRGFVGHCCIYAPKEPKQLTTNPPTCKAINITSFRDNSKQFYLPNWNKWSFVHKKHKSIFPGTG